MLHVYFCLKPTFMLTFFSLEQTTWPLYRLFSAYIFKHTLQYEYVLRSHPQQFETENQLNPPNHCTTRPRFMGINLTILVFSLSLHFLIVKSDGNFYKLKMKNKTKGKPHYSFKVLYIGFLLFLPVYPVRSSISQLQHTEVQTSSKAKMQHCELQSLLLSLPN